MRGCVNNSANSLRRIHRAIHCRAYGFSRSCTSLYTPVEKSAPSAPCARLRRKRQYNYVILCRLYARLSRVRPCTLLSAFTQAPRLTRNCFPNGSERAIHCRAYGFSRSCTSLYTPVEKSAPSAPCARLRRKRHLSAFTQAPRLTRNCFPNGSERAIHCRAYGFSRSCTSLYTPVEKSAPSAPCARLRRKRQTIPA